MTAAADRAAAEPQRGTWSSAVDTSPVVQVLDREGNVVGAGCLVAPDVVATCADMVDAAWGHGRGAGSAQDGVTVRFPTAPRQQDVDAEQADPADFSVTTAIRWDPEDASGVPGVALLRLLHGAPDGLRMAPLRRGGDLRGRRLTVFGFPDGLVDGVWTTARSGPGEPGRLRLAADSGEPVLSAGFSGAPVWDTERRAVVGLAAVGPDPAQAALLPIEQVLGLDPDTLPCPYQGLSPFTEGHADLFFGRDVPIRRLLDLLTRQRLVVVAGGSGAGKSSLVHAGVAPLLRHDGVTVGVYRVTAVDEAEAQFRAATATVSAPSGEDGPAPDDAALIGRATAGLPEGRVVVVLDQLEDLAAARPDAAARLLALIVSAAQQAPDLRFLVTLRWESLEHLVTPEVAAVLGGGTYVLPIMGRAELRAAIMAPAAHPPGLDFEPGLVDAVLDEAGDEPGRLPHVEALLRLLWHERTGGVLTRAAYDAVGGVAGAVARQAEQAVAALTEAQLQDVRRLFSRLVTVDRDGGGFLRRARRLADFPADERALLDGLTAARLLVVGAEGAAADTVEPAHQALIDHWPRLQGWLAEDREFLTWQDEVEEQHRQWTTAAEDNGALLRGAALDAALDWQRRRAAEIAAPLRRYVDRSRARRRRDRRRLQAVVAVLVVLVGVAVGLTRVTTQRGDELSGQLALANAGTLGRASLSLALNDPAGATQLALRAYASDPHNSDAHAALLERYVAQRSVTAVHPHVVGSAIVQVNRSTDGRVLLLDALDGTSVLTDLTAGGEAEVWTLPPGRRTAVLSPDGRHALTADRSGLHTLLTIADRTEHTLVDNAFRTSSQSLVARFSPDGRHLALVANDGDSTIDQRLTVWDVSGDDPVELWSTPVAYETTTPAGLWVGDEGHTVTVHATAKGESSFLDRSTVLDVWRQGGTQPDRRGLKAGAHLGAEGRELYWCVGDNWVQDDPVHLRVYDTGTGAQARDLTLPQEAGCRFMNYTADGEHLLIGASASAPRTATDAQIASLRTGRIFDLTLPAEPDNLPSEALSLSHLGEAAPSVTAWDGPDGSLTALVARGDSLYEMRGRPDWIAADPQAQSGGRLTDDGRYLVTYDGRAEVQVRDAATGAPVARMTTDPSETGHPHFNAVDVDEDVLLHLYREEHGPEVHYTERTLPDLRRSVALRLPRSTETGPPSGAYVVSEGDRVYALVGSGRLLSVFDRTTGAQLGESVRIGPPMSQAPLKQDGGLLVLDPRDRDRLFATSTDGRTVVWSVSRGQEVATLPLDGGTANAFFVDAPRNRIIALDSDHHLQVIDATTWTTMREGIAMPGMERVVGVTPDGYAAVSGTRTTDTGVQLWDLGTGSPSGTLWAEQGAEPVRDLDGPTVTFERLDAMPAEYATTGEAWFAALCATDARPLTAAESALVPAGSPKEPCRGG